MKDKSSKPSRFGRDDSQNRFLRLKYILVRDNDFEKYNEGINNSEKGGMGVSKIQGIRGA